MFVWVYGALTAGAGTGGIRTASVVLRSRSVGIMQLTESPTSFQS